MLSEKRGRISLQEVENLSIICKRTLESPSNGNNIVQSMKILKPSAKAMSIERLEGQFFRLLASHRVQARKFSFRRPGRRRRRMIIPLACPSSYPCCPSSNPNKPHLLLLLLIVSAFVTTLGGTTITTSLPSSAQSLQQQPLLRIHHHQPELASTLSPLASSNVPLEISKRAVNPQGK